MPEVFTIEQRFEKFQKISPIPDADWNVRAYLLELREKLLPS